MSGYFLLIEHNIYQLFRKHQATMSDIPPALGALGI